MNYQFFYGLTFNPFAKGLPPQHTYASSDFKEFISRMEYFKSAKGFACVYGEPGSGKTTSLRAFTAKLNPQLSRWFIFRFPLPRFRTFIVIWR